MKVEKKGLRLKPIGKGCYTAGGYTSSSEEVTPNMLRRITRLLMRKIKPPEKAC